MVTGVGFSIASFIYFPNSILVQWVLLKHLPIRAIASALVRLNSLISSSKASGSEPFGNSTNFSASAGFSQVFLPIWNVMRRLPPENIK